ncbi:MAG: hypothetical protein GY757_54975, partial [bacterium]|nr:hypothetical protein [bacterium]
KVVVLTGYDTYFASGGTKDGLLAIQEGKAKFTDTRIYFIALECDIPVIAAMQGHGIGAGWSMGMYCDVVVFSEESAYRSPYMQYGFTPGAGATLIFPEQFGNDLGREILLTANEYKGEELRCRGIKMPVKSRGDVQTYAMVIASRLALSTREELTGLKAKSTEGLKNRLEKTVNQEVKMHDDTFVGNPEVLQRLQIHFDNGIQEAEKTEYPQSKRFDGGDSETDATILKGIRRLLRRTLAEELYMEPDTIDEEIPFLEFGLDSITGVTWVTKINDEYGLSINATKIYNHPTIRELAIFVMKEGKRQGLFQQEKKSSISPKPQEKIVYSTHSPLKKRRLRKPCRSLKMIAKEDPEPKNRVHAIAVIGMSGQFPKSETLDEFWDNLIHRRDCISEVPPVRWDIKEYYHPDPQVPRKTY